MLASNWDENKIRFPIIAQPKIDGVRGLNILGDLYARSLKPFKNRHANSLYGVDKFAGLDGELIAGVDPTTQNLCRSTTSALNSFAGAPRLTWFVFDMFTPTVINLRYQARYDALVRRVEQLNHENVQYVRGITVYDMSSLLEWDQRWLKMGYEGTIIRDPNGFYKQGRSTASEGGLLRIKAFVEEEAEITRVEEGQTNNNPAQTNELGKTFRTTHQENMVPNGQVGNIYGRLLKNVEWRGKIILRKGDEIKVSAGCLTQAERKYYWENQDKIRGKIMKFQFFPQGQKDKPRFPTFQSFRMKEDM